MPSLLIPPVKRFLAIIGIGWIMAGAIAGCSKDRSGVGKTVPVVGKVTVAGRPVMGGNVRTVIFRPDAAKGNQSKHEPRGDIDSEGIYKLLTISTVEGAPLGWYKVAVVITEQRDPRDPYSPVRYLIKEKYADVDASGLAIEVVENPAPGAYDLNLVK